MTDEMRRLISENYVGSWSFDEEDLSTPIATALVVYAMWEEAYADDGGVQGFTVDDLADWLQEQADNQGVVVTETQLGNVHAEGGDQ